MRRTLLLLFVAITATYVPGVGANSTGVSASAPECPPIAPAPRLAISQHSDFARIAGQLIVVGFNGDTPAAQGVQQVTRHLADGLISGVLLLGRNISSQENLSRLTRALSQSGTYPPFVMIDQEGGYIRRIRRFDSVDPVASAGFVAAHLSVEQARALYAKLATQLAGLGVNVNLGPVVDLNVNPDGPVIGRLERAFGSKPSVVAGYAAAFVKAHNEAGVLTALKHFPGHGSSTTDPHIGANDITGTWSKTELVPFRELIRRQLADMVMTAHVILAKPPVDTQGQVVSLSRNAIGNVLRKNLCFDGVVITDDLAMRAIRVDYSEEQAAVEAIRAGNDIILLAKSDDLAGLPPRINRALVTEAKNNPAFRQRLRQAYSRVMRLKQRLRASGE